LSVVLHVLQIWASVAGEDEAVLAIAMEADGLVVSAMMDKKEI
jgi:hypothetical protein